jgi:hypothetical protein
MNKLLSVSVLAAALAFQSMSASATYYDPNYDFGDMGPTASGVTKSIIASADSYGFYEDTDLFTFSISASTTASGTAPDVDLAYWLYDVDVKSVSLFKSVSGTDPQVGSTDTSTELFSFNNLTAGNYYLKVVVNGDANYQVTLSTSPSATAVPEPEAYAMMLAGLGLVGFAARRKLK